MPRLLETVVPLLTALLTTPLAGCGEPLSPATTGSLEVTLTTTGTPTGGVGYWLQLDGTMREPVAAEGRTTITGLAAGPHTVELLDLPPECALIEEVRHSIQVTPGATTRVLFTVTCAEASGSLEVITSISGDSLDPDGYVVAVDGLPPQSLGVTDMVLFEDLPAGHRQVSLSGIAPNCTPDGALPRSAYVRPGMRATVAIAVRCQAPGLGGVIQVTVTSTLINAGAIQSYSAVLDGRTSMAVRPNGSVSFTGVPAGEHAVRLRVPSYCSVGGFRPAPNPVRLVLPADGYQIVRFSVLCIG